jgi:4-hydroxy-2-oxoheptanedioate aldolase
MTGFATGGRGAWCNDSSPGAVARLARAGFDWVCLDGQHGLYTRTEIVDAARSFPHDAADLVVRVAACDFVRIGEVLDAGASAVIVPQIEAPEQAAAAVAATYYPPLGSRSFGPFVRTWGRPGDDPETANARIRCAVMIESARALERVEEIAAVPGLSQLFIGPSDLSLSLGISVADLLQDDSESSPLRRIVAAAEAAGLEVGAFGGVPAVAEQFPAFGITCLAVATDLWLLGEGARAALS